MPTGREFEVVLDVRAVNRLLGPRGPNGPVYGAIVEGAARILRQEIVDKIERSSPTGREYTIPGTSSTYTASAPGEPPAVREAVYRDAWGVVGPIVDGSRIMAAAVNDRRVGANGEYLLGLLLEYGTSDLVNFRVRMRPRPHIRPARMTAKPKIEAWIRRFSR